MNYALLLRMVIARLVRYKAKVLMMGVGIVISVLTTAVIQTSGAGFLESITSYTSHYYPADTLVLMSKAKGRLKIDDLEAIAATSREITGWDPVVGGDLRTLKNRDQSTQVPLWGYSANAETIGHRSVSQGDFISDDDVRTRARVALIGAATARKLFGSESPLGADLYIDNVPFKVKGVLETFGVDPHGQDQDDTLLVPYTTLMEQILRVEYLNAGRFVVTDSDRIDAVARQVKAVVRERHGIVANQEDDFVTVTPGEIRQRVARSLMIYRVFLPLIGGTAFLISGLVILSIMLATINERTAEFGLRKALGARPADIRVQLLLEVMLVSVNAGVVGMLLAKLVMAQLAPILKVKFGIVHATPSAFILAVGTLLAILTGIAGALIPARRAAELDSAVALK